MGVNIVVCGTPGTGKSTLVERLKCELPEGDKFKYINLSEFALQYKCISSYDHELETNVIDEEALCELLEPILKLEGKCTIVESIHADILPSTLVDLVFVCRTDNTKLYDRLKLRGYNEAKISNNLQAEIFQTIVDEARESFGEKITFELINNDMENLAENVKTIAHMVGKLVDDAK